MHKYPMTVAKHQDGCKLLISFNSNQSSCPQSGRVLSWQGWLRCPSSRRRSRPHPTLETLLSPPGCVPLLGAAWNRIPRLSWTGGPAGSIPSVALSLVRPHPVSTRPCAPTKPPVQRIVLSKQPTIPPPVCLFPETR